MCNLETKGTKNGAYGQRERLVVALGLFALAIMSGHSSRKGTWIWGCFQHQVLRRPAFRMGALNGFTLRAGSLLHEWTQERLAGVQSEGQDPRRPVPRLGKANPPCSGIHRRPRPGLSRVQEQVRVAGVEVARAPSPSPQTTRAGPRP